MRSVLVHVNHVVGGSAVLQSRLAKRGERAVYGLLDPLKTITDIADDVLLLSQNINYEELREIQCNGKGGVACSRAYDIECNVFDLVFIPFLMAFVVNILDSWVRIANCRVADPTLLFVSSWAKKTLPLGRTNLSINVGYKINSM
ncbi:hypothetical protein V6N11_076565 [Hibiscus sabdariffa]|uniref:Uncharacterized protein n=1 Tax=Hibiscus sabdariffa TaxID=183260 RepID=A0ABR2Q6P8_9ROSI